MLLSVPNFSILYFRDPDTTKHITLLYVSTSSGRRRPLHAVASSMLVYATGRRQIHKLSQRLRIRCYTVYDMFDYILYTIRCAVHAVLYWDSFRVLRDSCTVYTIRYILCTMYNAHYTIYFVLYQIPKVIAQKECVPGRLWSQRQ